MANLPPPDGNPGLDQDAPPEDAVRIIVILPVPETDEHLCQFEGVPPNIGGAPTNHLRVENDGGTEGQYFIDVSMPPAPQPAVSGPENVLLHTRNGTVSADIWVTGNNALMRVSMKFRSDNGDVYVKLVRLLSASSKIYSQYQKKPQHDVFSRNEPRPSLHLDLSSHYGDISLSLPRGFRGPMKVHTVTTHDRIAFSPAFTERMALLSDVDGVRVYFVGDRPESPEEPLDELSVGGWHSSVRIRWDGEPELGYMNRDGWTNFFMGSARFFTTGRVD